MTQKEKLEQLESAILTAEKRIISQSKTVESLCHQFRKLECEWKVYENKYRNYLAKRDRFQNFLWWLWCKVTFRSTKLTKKESIKHTAKKMTRVFYKGGCK